MDSGSASSIDIEAYEGYALSYGAGVNSTALAILLIKAGWGGPIVFAETGTEWPDTYCFMDYFESEWLRPRNMAILRIGAEWRGSDRQLSLIEYCEQRHYIPIMAQRWCTARWKVEPCEKYRDAGGYTAYMLGIDAGEQQRAQGTIRPLVDWGLDREDCIQVIEAQGLPIPRKSGCYICPFQSDHQWRELWHKHPELFARAEALEIHCDGFKRRQTSDPVAIDIRGITLSQKRLAFEAQETLPGIDMDALKRYQPCICGL